MTQPASPSYPNKRSRVGLPHRRHSTEELEHLRAAYHAACAERGVAFGYCFCRCGNKTHISAENDRQFGYIAGYPRRLLRGHRLTAVTGAPRLCESCGGPRIGFYGTQCRACYHLNQGKERVIDAVVYAIEGVDCRRIHLGGEYWATVYASDYDMLMRYKWHACKNNNGDVYARSARVGKMHRFLMGAKGRWALVDHIKKPTLDNRRRNLRATDVFGNNQNRLLSSVNKTGFKGVDELPSGRFRSQISFRGKKYNLGEYATAVEAHKAYRVKAKELHGEFANFG